MLTVEQPYGHLAPGTLFREKLDFHANRRTFIEMLASLMIMRHIAAYDL